MRAALRGKAGADTKPARAIGKRGVIGLLMEHLKLVETPRCAPHRGPHPAYGWFSHSRKGEREKWN
jgi:hypothetical protein